MLPSFFACGGVNEALQGAGVVGISGDKRAPCPVSEQALASASLGSSTSPPRNQKRFHSRYNFGYGILLYIRKMPVFRPLTALFGGSRGIFSYKTNKSAILCPTKTEVADFVSFKGSIVQGFNRSRNKFTKKYCLMSKNVI